MELIARDSPKERRMTPAVALSATVEASPARLVKADLDTAARI